MKDILRKLYNSEILTRIIHTRKYCLQKELKDCDTVLDLGCGHNSPIQCCRNISYSVGVDVFKSYIDLARKRRTHSKLICKKLDEIEFPDKSFDAVVMIEVIEHIPKRQGMKLIRKAEKWAKKKVILTTPNVYFSGFESDGNPYEKHVSLWNCEELAKLGFRTNGLVGLKFLRKEADMSNLHSDDDLIGTIKYSPKYFWLMISILSQIFTYHLPQYAFELISVKDVERKMPP